MIIQAPITLTGTAVQVLATDPNRRYLLIQNYVASPGKMYLSFAAVATAGTNGEYELPAGAVISFGAVPPAVISPNTTYSAPACPTGALSIINGGGNANGMFQVYSG